MAWKFLIKVQIYDTLNLVWKKLAEPNRLVDICINIFTMNIVFDIVYKYVIWDSNEYNILFYWVISNKKLKRTLACSFWSQTFQWSKLELSGKDESRVEIVFQKVTFLLITLNYFSNYLWCMSITRKKNKE